MNNNKNSQRIRQDVQPKYGYYYFKPYIYMLHFFLIIGICIYGMGYNLNFSYLKYLGIGIGLYGILTTIGWALARYVIPGNRVKVARNVIRDLNLKGNENILDVGSGRGIYAIEAAKQLSTGKVTGIDLWDPEKANNIVYQHKLSQPSHNSIENAINNALIEGVDKKIEFINMDVNNLHFAKSAFDVVICGFIVGHQGKYILNTLKEIKKVLKNKGKIVIVDNYRDFTYFMLSTPHLFLLSYLRGTKAKRLTYNNWISWVENSGFQINKISSSRGIITIKAIKNES